MAMTLSKWERLNQDFQQIDDAQTANKFVNLSFHPETCTMLKTPKRRNAADGEVSQKRIVTEERKEQNRVASKAYRQRQKEKLLNMRSKRRGIQELRPRPAPSVQQSSSIPDHNNHLDINEFQSQGATDDLFQSSVLPEPSKDSAVRGEYNLTPGQLGARGCGMVNSSTTPHEAEDLDTTLNDKLPPIMSDISDTEMPLDVVNQNAFPGRDIGLLTFLSPTQEDSLQEQDPVSFPLSWELEDSNMPGMQSDLLLGHPSQNRTSLVPSRPSVADPYANCMQLWRGSAFTAGIYSAILVGFDMENIRLSEWLSPFYRPTTPADDPNALLALARIPYAPASLQPTLPQILFPHHAYLDLIPFPTFRARAITFSSTVPPLFDWWDLKRDINAGLVCSNSWNGAGGGDFQPWEAHSWKAAPWFLKKWRMLIN